MSPDFYPVAFVDDNRALRGSYIHGLRVYSFIQLGKVLDDLALKEILTGLTPITISGADVMAYLFNEGSSAKVGDLEERFKEYLREKCRKISDGFLMT